MPLSYGLRLSVEGRVVGGFELCGADHAKAGVESSLVVPVDPAGGGVFDVGQRLGLTLFVDIGSSGFLGDCVVLLLKGYRAICPRAEWRRRRL